MFRLIGDPYGQKSLVSLKSPNDWTRLALENPALRKKSVMNSAVSPMKWKSN